jgi:hypothetical protein
LRGQIFIQFSAEFLSILVPKVPSEIQIRRTTTQHEKHPNGTENSQTVRKTAKRYPKKAKRYEKQPNGTENSQTAPKKTAKRYKKQPNGTENRQTV